MLQTKKRVILAIITGILLLSWMAVIFFFSCEDGQKSGKTSTDKVTEMLEVVTPSKPPEQIKNQVSNNQKSIRKTAHFLVYSVLGLLSTAFFTTAGVTSAKNRFILSVSLCYFYAATDELHQYFVVGRSGLVSDIIIDLLGALVAVVLFFAAEKMWKFFKEKKGFHFWKFA